MKSENSQNGQAAVEYVLLLVVISFAFLILINGLSQMKFTKKMSTWVMGDFAHAYQYGHPKALGYDDGGPKNHPRAPKGEGNFRIFISPVSQ